MPGPFAPNDTLIGPIVQKIASLVAVQIPSISHVYVDLPDRAPMDNSVILPLIRGKVLSETNGKQKIRLTFSMRHLFRRKNMPDNIAQAYTYVMPWLNFLAAWTNQTLGGLSIEVDATDLRITQMSESGQPMVALMIDFDVLTEYNIPLT